MHILNQLRWQLQLLFHNGHDAGNIHKGPNSRPYFSPLLQILSQQTQKNILPYMCSPHWIIISFYLAAFHVIFAVLYVKMDLSWCLQKLMEIFSMIFSGHCNRPTVCNNISQIYELSCEFSDEQRIYTKDTVNRLMKCTKHETKWHYTALSMRFIISLKLS